MSGRIVCLCLAGLIFFSCEKNSTGNEKEIYNRVEFTINGGEWDNHPFKIRSLALPGAGVSLNDSLCLLYMFAFWNEYTSPDIFSATLCGDSAGHYQFEETGLRYRNTMMFQMDMSDFASSLHSISGSVTIDNFPDVGEMMNGSFSGRFTTLAIPVWDSTSVYYLCDTVDITGTFSMLRVQNNQHYISVLQ